MRINKDSDFIKMYRFHILYSLMRCRIGTFRVILDKARFPKDNALSIITFSIFPQLTRIWYYFFTRIADSLNKYGYKTELIIIDCHGNLCVRRFPNAVIHRFVNIYHGRKLDYFVLRKIKGKLVWVCDDDTFIYSPELALESVQSFYSDPNQAAISFMPRFRWRIHINNEEVMPMGSYCVLLNRDIVTKERLLFSSNPTNPHYPGNKYDTGDFMHEALLKRGYNVKILDQHMRDEYVLGFKGGSISKILEWGCSKEELTDYFRNPFSYGGHLRYHLLSFYISTKVSEIYNKLFNDDKYFPLFKENELMTFIDGIRDEGCKKTIIELFDSTKKSYKKILEIIGGERSD